MAAFTALFKNTRTLKFKGQLTFAYFAAVNHLRKQWSVIGGFRLAYVQTPLPSGKIWEGTPSPIFPEGRGVCTQARFRSVLCVSVFHRSFLNFRVRVFWQGTSHLKSPRTTGNEAARVCKKRSKLPQKFCYHGNVATHFFFRNSAVNTPPPLPPYQESSCFPQICTSRSPKIFPDPKFSNLSPPCFFNFANFFFIPRTSRCKYQLLPTWIRSVLALLFRARRTN